MRRQTGHRCDQHPVPVERDSLSSTANRFEPLRILGQLILRTQIKAVAASIQAHQRDSSGAHDRGKPTNEDIAGRAPSKARPGDRSALATVFRASHLSRRPPQKRTEADKPHLGLDDRPCHRSTFLKPTLIQSPSDANGATATPRSPSLARILSSTISGRRTPEAATVVRT